MHAILPPLETYAPEDFRNGRASFAIIRNRALQECGAAIVAAGGTYSHRRRFYELTLDDGLLVRGRVPHRELRPRSQSNNSN